MEQKKILIVIDMQKDFIDGSLGTSEAQAIVENVVRVINSFEGTVLYTMDTHYDNYMNTLEGKKLPVLHCIKGTEGWQIEPRVLQALEKKAAKCFEKPTFGSYELAEYVESIVPDSFKAEITIMGLCTEICVASNGLLLRSKLPNAKITVLADCCAGVTPESHLAALATLSSCQLDVK